MIPYGWQTIDGDDIKYVAEVCNGMQTIIFQNQGR